MATGNTTVSPACIWIRNPGSFVLSLMSQLACPLSSPFGLPWASVSSPKELRACVEMTAVRGSCWGHWLPRQLGDPEALS